jgi:hypothetical protein
VAVSKRLRYEVLRRDNHQCRYCHSTENPLTVDHVIPSTLGGTDDPANLVAACRDCNAGKSASNPDAPLVADVEQDALRWSNAMKRVAEMAQQQRRARIQSASNWLKAWDGWVDSWTRDVHPLPQEFADNLMQWIDLGLTESDLVSFIPIAMRKPMSTDARWPYFRGICWRTLDNRREQAQQLLRAEEEF